MITNTAYPVLISEPSIVAGMVLHHESPKLGQWNWLELHHPLVDSRSGFPLHVDKQPHFLLNTTGRVLSHQLIHTCMPGFRGSNGQVALPLHLQGVVRDHLLALMVPQEGWLGVAGYLNFERNSFSLRNMGVLRKLLDDWLNSFLSFPILRCLFEVDWWRRPCRGTGLSGILVLWRIPPTQLI